MFVRTAINLPLQDENDDIRIQIQNDALKRLIYINIDKSLCDTFKRNKNENYAISQFCGKNAKFFIYREILLSIIRFDLTQRCQIHKMLKMSISNQTNGNSKRKYPINRYEPKKLMNTYYQINIHGLHIYYQCGIKSNYNQSRNDTILLIIFVHVGLEIILHYLKFF